MGLAAILYTQYGEKLKLRARGLGPQVRPQYAEPAQQTTPKA
jgi:hypothetical protein